ncbi:cupin domain-containing protein [Brevibacterium sp. UCMA 11754]|uniref:cupin domain-containing protein n=1 Tax=Brevibacterium sp. UCMA 11754 TaxID=2749198 RepID=UPI001F352075|nr:cupin domain-containing protein [Brevibacterium sp. UCMA 11754]MCF2573573.1 cupin domain-containing protein [Brevibacterium sp. UCMA 11754]
MGTIAGAEYGLWEMSAGAMRDVEGEEVFLVISGTGRIEFDSPELSPVVLSPGRLVRLEPGMKTRWYVNAAPLRKLFISPRD